MRSLLISAVCALVAHQVSAGELVLHGISLHTSSGWTQTTTTNHYATNTSVYRRRTGPNQFETIEVTTTQLLYTETSQTFHRYRGANFGVGLITDDGWIVGTYKNSFNKQTVYFGKQFPVSDTNLSFNVAAATGYKTVEKGRTVVPIAAFDYKLPINNEHSLHMTLVPAVRSGSASALMLSVGQNF